ncbi:General transcription and DNA repair factor IIH helicase subunit XPD [Cucumispora dikerogammari]|nr:General transcription and DNA repair factor IIH helicase subunit XPD [Cucumispora dikerogammari]
MKLIINKIPVYFPYKEVFPDQLDYIKEILSTIQTKGNICIQMPCGAGKTVSLLSATVSFQLHQKRLEISSQLLGEPIKIIYCCRTFGEVMKTFEELDTLYKYILKNHLDENKDTSFLAVGLTNKESFYEKSVMSKCDNIQGERKCKTSDNSQELNVSVCAISASLTDSGLLEELSIGKPSLTEETSLIKDKAITETFAIKMPSGVYNLKDAKEYIFSKGICNCFNSSSLISFTDFLIFRFDYLLDPNTLEITNKKVSRSSVVIFDEAHNIDNACIENYSIRIDKTDLQKAAVGAREINERLNFLRENETPDKISEYLGLVGIPHNLDKIHNYDYSDISDLVIIPGNIRRPQHFLSLLKRLIEFFKIKLKYNNIITYSTSSFTKSVTETIFVDKWTQTFTSQRFVQIIKELEIKFSPNFYSLKKLVDFVTLSSQLNEGFIITFEPNDYLNKNVFNPILKLSCLDASIGFRTIFGFRNVIITSGTLGTLEIYPLILGLPMEKLVEVNGDMPGHCICPVIVSKGSDQQIIISDPPGLLSNTVGLKGFSDVSDISSSHGATSIGNLYSNQPNNTIKCPNTRNYSSLIIELTQVVPDGIVIFFSSQELLTEVISSQNTINKITKNKLLFIEPSNRKESKSIIQSYKHAIDSGIGSVILCVTRGPISEERSNFNNQYGRCVILIGMPFQSTNSVAFMKRLEYLNGKINLSNFEFLVFDAMRTVSECLGRVVRNRNDYGLLVLADSRFVPKGIRLNLPSWIIKALNGINVGVSVDGVKEVGKDFFRRVGWSRWKY